MRVLMLMIALLTAELAVEPNCTYPQASYRRRAHAPTPHARWHVFVCVT